MLVTTASNYRIQKCDQQKKKTFRGIHNVFAI